MNPSYGNTSWEIFVYGTYVLVILFLLIYVFFAFHSRKMALKSLAEEGFLENPENLGEKKNEN
jgi:high-affinity Fe2+/Pb2+ permease